jgi:hypothetical protein
MYYSYSVIVERAIIIGSLLSYHGLPFTRNRLHIELDQRAISLKMRVLFGSHRQHIPPKLAPYSPLTGSVFRQNWLPICLSQAAFSAKIGSLFASHRSLE